MGIKPRRPDYKVDEELIKQKAQKNALVAMLSNQMIVGARKSVKVIDENAQIKRDYHSMNKEEALELHSKGGPD